MTSAGNTNELGYSLTPKTTSHSASNRSLPHSEPKNTSTPNLPNHPPPPSFQHDINSLRKPIASRQLRDDRQSLAPTNLTSELTVTNHHRHRDSKYSIYSPSSLYHSLPRGGYDAQTETSFSPSKLGSNLNRRGSRLTHQNRYSSIREYHHQLDAEERNNLIETFKDQMKTYYLYQDKLEKLQQEFYSVKSEADLEEEDFLKYTRGTKSKNGQDRITNIFNRFAGQNKSKIQDFENEIRDVKQKMQNVDLEIKKLKETAKNHHLNLENFQKQATYEAQSKRVSNSKINRPQDAISLPSEIHEENESIHGSEYYQAASMPWLEEIRHEMAKSEGGSQENIKKKEESEGDMFADTKSIEEKSSVKLNSYYNSILVQLGEGQQAMEQRLSARLDEFTRQFNALAEQNSDLHEQYEAIRHDQQRLHEETQSFRDQLNFLTSSFANSENQLMTIKNKHSHLEQELYNLQAQLLSKENYQSPSAISHITTGPRDFLSLIQRRQDEVYQREDNRKRTLFFTILSYSIIPLVAIFFTLITPMNLVLNQLIQAYYGWQTPGLTNGSRKIDSSTDPTSSGDELAKKKRSESGKRRKHRSGSFQAQTSISQIVFLVLLVILFIGIYCYGVWWLTARGFSSENGLYWFFTKKFGVIINGFVNRVLRPFISAVDDFQWEKASADLPKAEL